MAILIRNLCCCWLSCVGRLGRIPIYPYRVKKSDGGVFSILKTSKRYVHTSKVNGGAVLLAPYDALSAKKGGQ